MHVKDTWLYPQELASIEGLKVVGLSAALITGCSHLLDQQFQTERLNSLSPKSNRIPHSQSPIFILLFFLLICVGVLYTKPQFVTDVSNIF